MQALERADVRFETRWLPPGAADYMVSCSCHGACCDACRYALQRWPSYFLQPYARRGASP